MFSIRPLKGLIRPLKGLRNYSQRDKGSQFLFEWGPYKGKVRSNLFTLTSKPSKTPPISFWLSMKMVVWAAAGHGLSLYGLIKPLTAV